MNELSKLFDTKFLKFILVGAINTVLSTALMFLLYNLGNFGYWSSTIVSYIIGSIVSFTLNKKFTFKNEGPVLKTAIRFSVNVAICYIIAYGISRPLVSLILSSTSMSKSYTDQISMIFGVCLFSLINYIGQRFFAFR